MPWKTRTDGSSAQVGQKYQEKQSGSILGARAGASGTALPPQARSVDSMKKPQLGQERQKEGIYCNHDGMIKQTHCGKCLGKESYSKSHELREYTVSLKYADGSKETVKVNAHSPEESIHLGMLKVSPEHRQQRPTSVTSKNLIGEIVGKLAAWGVGGLKKTVKTYKETRRKSTLQERAKKGDIAAIQELRRLKTGEDIGKGQEEALKEEGLV
jgi:DnaJ-class molecular chaperone